LQTQKEDNSRGYSHRYRVFVNWRVTFTGFRGTGISDPNSTSGPPASSKDELRQQIEFYKDRYKQ
jgi:hypothetical protein